MDNLIITRNDILNVVDKYNAFKLAIYKEDEILLDALVKKYGINIIPDGGIPLKGIELWNAFDRTKNTNNEWVRKMIKKNRWGHIDYARIVILMLSYETKLPNWKPFHLFKKMDIKAITHECCFRDPGITADLRYYIRLICRNKFKKIDRQYLLDKILCQDAWDVMNLFNLCSASENKIDLKQRSVRINDDTTIRDIKRVFKYIDNSADSYVLSVKSPSNHPIYDLVSLHFASRGKILQCPYQLGLRLFKPRYIHIHSFVRKKHLNYIKKYADNKIKRIIDVKIQLYYTISTVFMNKNITKLVLYY